jgi:hypothetical protein
MATATESRPPIVEKQPDNNHNHTGQEYMETLPTAAQILLQDFTLPTFPAKASSLRALTLTCDIKPTEYSDLLNSTSPAEEEDTNQTSIPKEIESLTLELFSLGYPSPFLTRLGKALPKLKILTLYSQLGDGVSEASRKDAGDFFSDALTGGGHGHQEDGGLRELHLLDVFFRKGFVSGLGGILEDTSREVLRFLEVSYTYRGHSDSAFLDRISGDELPTMLVPSLIAASFSLAAPLTNPTGPADFPDDPADVDESGVPIPGRKPEGIIPLGHRHPGVEILMRKLTGTGEGEVAERKDDDKNNNDEDEPASLPGSGPGPRNLKMLDTTIYTLDATQLASIVRSQEGLAVLSASVIADVNDTKASKTALLDALQGGKDGHGGKELEIIEIVGIPEVGDDQNVSGLLLSN